MSVRPTLLSLAIALSLPVLLAAGVIINQCRAEADPARAEAQSQTLSEPVAGAAGEARAADEAQAERGAASEAAGQGGQPQSDASAEAGAAAKADAPAEAKNAETPTSGRSAPAKRNAAGGEAASELTPAEQAAEDAAKVEPYRWLARRSENKVKLRGFVPSEQDQRTVVGMAKAHFADLEIDDGLKIAGGAPPKEQWLGAVSFALKQLTHIEAGNARLSDVSLTLDGRAKTAADYAELQGAVHGPLPTGMSVQKIAVSPPVAEPFMFTASLDGNILTLAGNVPNAELHSALQELAARAFQGRAIDDQLTIAAGAPKNWKDAAKAALAALSRLQEGKVTLSNGDLKIDGMAADKTTATELSFQLRRDLPSPYRASENIRWKEAGQRGDVANTIIPRIKEIVDGRGTTLPSALPSLEGQRTR